MSKSGDDTAKPVTIVDEHDRAVAATRLREKNSATLYQRLEALGITPVVRVGIPGLTPKGHFDLIGAEHDRQRQDRPSLIPLHAFENSPLPS